MLNQNLIITYSNQRLRELKSNNKFIKPVDRVLTLDELILEEYEKKNFKIIIDEFIAPSIIYKLIQDYSINYFDYLKADDDSLNIIYDFIVKCNRNNVAFDILLKNEKLDAIELINRKYQEFKKLNNLADIFDVEKYFFENIENMDFQTYKEVYIDNFSIQELSFIKSKVQENILKKFSKFKKLKEEKQSFIKPNIIKPNNQIFDNIDEVKTAIKIARKLMEVGASDNEILIVTTAIDEYAPLYKLFLDEYEMKGYSSLGTRLSSYYNSSSFDVRKGLLKFDSKVKELETLYKKIGLSFVDSIKEKVKYQITIKDERIGIEITDSNQLLGSSKKYKHLIFMGADINHFPPKAKDNFLCSYENEVKYFYKDDFFLSSQAQYEEIKKLCDNLYLINASNSGKRELSPSIIIDKKIDNTIDISDVISINELVYKSATCRDSFNKNEEYFKSINSNEFSKFDGLNVEGISAKYLSASQINRYNSCPLLYLYTNKLKLQAPGQDVDGFDAAEQGSLMHLCFELFGKKIKEKALKEESFDGINFKDLMFIISQDAYKEFLVDSKIKENINHKIFLSTLQSGLKDERDDGLLAKFVDYFEEFKDDLEYFKNSEFEKEFALNSDLKPYEIQDKSDKNYFIKGFIDRFDNLSNYINIIDYKSKKVNKIDKDKMEQIKELKDVQLALYILYTSQAYPNKEYYSSLLSFKTTNPYALFANLSNIDNIKDVEHYSDEYEKDLKQLIFDTKDNIESGKFNFDNSDEKNCEWCDIKFMCHSKIVNKVSNVFC